MRKTGCRLSAQIYLSLDTCVGRAVTVNIRGNSYRLKDKLKAGLVKA